MPNPSGSFSIGKEFLFTKWISQECYANNPTAGSTKNANPQEANRQINMTVAMTFPMSGMKIIGN
jgi:hypothetical protein